MLRLLLPAVLIVVLGVAPAWSGALPVDHQQMVDEAREAQEARDAALRQGDLGLAGRIERDEVARLKQQRTDGIDADNEKLALWRAGLISLPLPTLPALDSEPACGHGKRGSLGLVFGVSGKVANGTANDANLITEALLKRGFEVTKVITETLTRDAFFDRINNVLARTGCQDHVHLHVSAVGFPLAPMAVPGWEAQLYLGDFATQTKPVPLEHVIRGVDLALVVTALRNRSATVVLSLDTGFEPGLDIGGFLTKPWSWSGALAKEAAANRAMPPIKADLPVSARQGDFALLFSTDRKEGAPELPFDGVTHGRFSYALARAINAATSGTLQEVGEEILKLWTRNERGYGAKAWPLFEASHAHVPILPSSAPQAVSNLDIEILQPAALRIGLSYQAIAAKTPEFELIGRIANPRQVRLLTVDSHAGIDAVPLDANGQFKVKVTLAAGKNIITVMAQSADFKMNFRRLEFSYDGDLEHFAATGQRYALVIGVQTYDPKHFPLLSTPLKDAKAVADVLRKEYGFRTDIETNSGQTASLFLPDATQRDINTALTHLIRRMTEHDQLLIYFAGHGVNHTRATYWIPKDGAADDDSTWISAATLRERIAKLNARSVLVVSDSCFSGEFSRSPMDLSAFSAEKRQALLKAGAKKSRMLIASGGNEPVLDRGCDGQDHSIFACAFLKGLREEPAQVFSTADLFHTHIYAPVFGKSQQEPRRKELSDTNHDGGDFIFARIAAQKIGQEIQARAAGSKP